ncbi:MAG: LL-diaminopimelate aminotransferase [Bacteroidales bacterium]|nr:LL-diaminopimelate aminotransferase [Bacteroidales bacterium]
MAYINDNFTKIQHRYLFADVAKRVAAYKEQNPDVEIIRLGIGDVTQPLVPAVIEAMHRAVDDCAKAETFHGYGPEQGYKFLIDKIIEHDYKLRGINFDSDEVFISDGAKSDLGNIGDILSVNNLVGVTDPVYPVYVDTNTMAGRQIRYIPCNEQNGFMGDIPNEKLDVMYLCFPNNPTGAVITREGLQRWVDYALSHNTLLMYDSAYEAYITDPEIPHSIYEIPGAKECAIEFRSFSKTAGFTGVRCGYTVIPKELKIKSSDGSFAALNPVWNRRQCTKFNGASYISQRGAEAVYSPEGQRQIKEVIKYYLDNAKIIRSSLQKFGFKTFGGENAPYIWVKTPGNEDSWSFFDRLLHHAQVVTTPGAGFGTSGEGYIRITAFGSHQNSEEAMRRIEKMG